MDLSVFRSYMSIYKCISDDTRECAEFGVEFLSDRPFIIEATSQVQVGVYKVSRRCQIYHNIRVIYRVPLKFYKRPTRSVGSVAHGHLSTISYDLSISLSRPTREDYFHTLVRGRRYYLSLTR